MKPKNQQNETLSLQNTNNTVNLSNVNYPNHNVLINVNHYSGSYYGKNSFNAANKPKSTAKISYKTFNENQSIFHNTNIDNPLQDNNSRKNLPVLKKKADKIVITKRHTSVSKNKLVLPFVMK